MSEIRKRGRPRKHPLSAQANHVKPVQITTPPETLEAALLIQMDAFVDTTTVERLTTLSKMEIYRRVSDGRFPQPHRIGGKRKAWQISQIKNWIQEQATCGIMA